MDLLVKLYELPDAGELIEQLAKNEIVIRIAAPYERVELLEWVGKNFDNSWVGECEIAFSRQPISCYVAVRKEKCLGFACYDVTNRGFFGPIGVDESMRGSGVGKALLLSCLRAMKNVGYGYGIIGAGSGVRKFYEKSCGATVIEGSAPGVYVTKITN